ncbi:MAG: DUF433 domain-containing protein [Dehalococcoidia bacterium]
MAVGVVAIDKLITRDPSWHRGFPHVTGKRVTVASVARLAAEGATPEEIAGDRYERLTLAEVHAALAFYYSNRELVDQQVADEFQEHERLRGEYGRAAR